MAVHAVEDCKIFENGEVGVIAAGDQDGDSHPPQGMKCGSGGAAEVQD